MRQSGWPTFLTEIEHALNLTTCYENLSKFQKQTSVESLHPIFVIIILFCNFFPFSLSLSFMSKKTNFQVIVEVKSCLDYKTRFFLLCDAEKDRDRHKSD